MPKRAQIIFNIYAAIIGGNMWNLFISRSRGRLELIIPLEEALKVLLNQIETSVNSIRNWGSICVCFKWKSNSYSVNKTMLCAVIRRLDMVTDK